MSTTEKMTSKHDRYIYHGMVFDGFNHIIEEKWYGETTAPTFNKAITNLKYQYRQESGLPNYKCLYLEPTRLRMVEPPPIRLKEDILEDKKEEPTCQQLTLTLL